MRLLARWFLIFALAAAATAQAVRADTLTINANTSDPAPRAAWQAIVERFRAEHPEISVELNIYDHESYKKSLRNWLTSAAPDVIFWNAGYRMRQLVALGLLEDVSGLFADAAPPPDAAVMDLVSVAGRQYGVPFAHYQVGLYYRRDLFESAGIGSEPATWSELLAACDKLKGHGIAPIAIGSKDLWPMAGWFDYLDFRINGYDFHQQLMSGKIAYTDDRVRAIFAKWRELIERGCFAKGHVAMSWQESQLQLYQGKAAMMLIGNFIVANFPPEIRDRMEFARFPTIDPEAGNVEDAPMNSLHIPARAGNKRDARTFLAFVLRPGIQEALSRALLVIPAIAAAGMPDDRFLQEGRALLLEADHLAQYFDRDTSEDLATIAMKGFQEFMVAPDRLDAILATIERARMRIYP